MSTASVQTLRMIVAAWTARGKPVSELLAEIGLQPHLLLDPDGRVPEEVARRAWRVAAERSGDPHFGLGVAEIVQAHDYGALGYALSSSATLGEALRRLANAFRLFRQQASLTLVEERTVARVRVDTHAQDPADLQHPVECLLARLLAGGRRATGQSFPLLGVSFQHPPPEETGAHEQVFGVAPRFSADHNELTIPRAVLALRLRTHDPAALESMDRHLQQLLCNLPPDESFQGRVRRVLTEELRRGEPALEAVAGRLGMSGRTLQRRLRDEGLGFHALLDALRCDLARRHIAEPRESTAEIAFLLGFSEVSTFHRAFKRWTGLTPGAYRQKGQKAAGRA